MLRATCKRHAFTSCSDKSCSIRGKRPRLSKPISRVSVRIRPMSWPLTPASDRRKLWAEVRRRKRWWSASEIWPRKTRIRTIWTKSITQWGISTLRNATRQMPLRLTKKGVRNLRVMALKRAYSCSALPNSIGNKGDMTWHKPVTAKPSGHYTKSTISMKKWNAVPPCSMP